MNFDHYRYSDDLYEEYMSEYNSYGDWYDSGPGSESFKRSLYDEKTILSIFVFKALLKKSDEKVKKKKTKNEILSDDLFEI